LFLLLQQLHVVTTQLEEGSRWSKWYVNVVCFSTTRSSRRERIDSLVNWCRI